MRHTQKGDFQLNITTTGGSDAMHLSAQHFAEVVYALRHSGSELSGHERRQITRIEVQCRLQIARYTSGSGGEEFTALTRDISIGGIGLLQSIQMKPGEEIVVRLPRQDRTPLFMLSKITYCHQMADGIYGIGVQFNRLLNLDSTPQKTIEQIRQSILG